MLMDEAWQNPITKAIKAFDLEHFPAPPYKGWWNPIKACSSLVRAETMTALVISASDQTNSFSSRDSWSVFLLSPMRCWQFLISVWRVALDSMGEDVLEACS